MKQMATFRETFLELADYLEKLAEQKYEESLEKDDKKIDVGPEEARRRGRELIAFEDYDDPHRNLMRLTRGELASFIYCGRATDVAPAVALAKNNGFFDRTTLVLGSECFKAMDAIKAGTSVAAELIGQSKNLGALVAGMSADIVAVPGNLLEDIAVLQQVVFVMKNGAIVRNDP